MKLNPGEVLCDCCKGSGVKILTTKGDEVGFIEYYNEDYNEVSKTVYRPDIKTEIKCEKCNGRGKLDWVQAVVGIRKDPNTMADLNAQILKQNQARFQSEMMKAQAQAQAQMQQAQYNQQMAAMSSQIRGLSNYNNADATSGLLGIQGGLDSKVYVDTEDKDPWYNRLINFFKRHYVKG